MSHSYDRLHQICPLDLHLLCQNPDLDWSFVDSHPNGIKINVKNPGDYYDCNDFPGGYPLAKKYLVDISMRNSNFCKIEYYEYDIKTGVSTQVSITDFYQGTKYCIGLNEMINPHVNDNLDFYLNCLFKKQEFKDYVSKYTSNRVCDVGTLKQLGIKMLNLVPGCLDNLIVKDEVLVKKVQTLNNKFIDGVFIVVKWPTYYLNRNPNLQWNFISKHPYGFDDNKWNIDVICSTIKLDSTFYEYIKSHPEGFNGENWPLFSLLRNKTLDWSFIDDNFYIFKDCKCNLNEDLKKYIYLNPTLCWRFICKYPDGINDLKWNLSFLCCNPNLGEELWKFIYENPSGFNGSRWDMSSLCANPNLGDKFWIYVSEYPEGLFGRFNVFSWDINVLSMNTSLPWYLVLNYPKGLNGKPWNMKFLCENSGLEKGFFEYVAEHDTFFGAKWDYDALCKNTSEHLIPVLFSKFQKMKLSPSNIESLLWNPEAKKHIKDILSFDCFNIEYFCYSISMLDYLLSSNEYLLWEDFIESFNDVTYKNPITMFNTCGLLQNISLTKNPCFWKFVKENPTGFSKYGMQQKWAIHDIQTCPNFDWNLLDEFPNGFNGQKWSTFSLASNPSFEVNILKTHPDGINGESWPCIVWELQLINSF